MTFAETLDQVRELLQSKQRVSYRALKRQFDLDDDYLEDLKAELIDAEHVAADEDGKVLVWTGGTTVVSSQLSVLSSSQPPTPQTPNSELRTPHFPSSQTLDPRRQTLDSAAERRQLTVMFCDLVGSTALSAQLDPEELREVVRGYQETCTAVIQRYTGHIAQHLGDGLLVYFGYPSAHEDDAVRAVRAGLEIVQALRLQVPSPLRGEGQGEGEKVAQLQNTPHPNLLPQGEKELRGLQVRIGIHTGLVVIGEIGSSEKREILALGETPNIAARMQGTANPDEVVISAATYRLVEGLFTCEDRGQPELKGIATPLTLYHVINESDAHSRFEVVVRKGLTPLIGREHEFGLLRERWERVKDGAGQVVLLSGEPGIGKSRLVEALKETVEHDGVRFLELRCSPYTQNSALAPVIEYVQRALQFQPEDTSEEKLHRLVQGLGRLERSAEPVIASAAKQSLQGTEIASSPEPVLSLVEGAPRNDTTRLQEMISLFASLLSLPAPSSALPALSPQKQKEKTHEALVTWLCAEAKHQAVTYAWEDLHWADPSTLELLTLFLAQVPTTRLLAVFTFRPEFVPSWGSHSYLSQLTLSRLGQQQVREMVNHVIEQVVRASTSSARTGNLSLFVSDSVRPEPVEGRVALPDDLVNAVIARTDGVPLFVEELTKSVVESVGTKDVSPPHLGIPATLQDALMARLDRLGSAKEIAQLGATLGREFNYELLKAVSPLNEESLQQGLKQLVDAELVFQSGIPPQARYLFKHALVQDTAYQSLLKSRRQQLHQQIAQVVEQRFAEIKETQPELLAHHYTEAGLKEQAIPYWQRAGQRANQRSAYVEAINHLTKGLDVLKALPDTPTRVQQELTLQLTLGSALVAVKGYTVPEVEKTVLRARELSLQLGETPQLFPVLFQLTLFYFMRRGRDLQTARELAEHLLRLAQSLQDSYSLSIAHMALGCTLFWLGELPSAQPHLEQAIALYDPQTHPRSTVGTVDPRVDCLSYVSWTLWYLGYPDQGLKRSQEAVALAERLSHPYSLTLALGCAAGFHLFRREGSFAQRQAEVAITLSTEHGFPSWVAVATLMRGWALVEQGQVQEGIAQVHQGMAAYQATGSSQRPSFLALLAEAYGKVGQVEKGITLLAETLVMVDKTGERLDEAELYRLRGELTLQQFNVQGSKSKVQEAEECFHKAIDVARKQQAKSLELRAATSLTCLWQQQGKRAEAHKLLSEVYNCFTEGFDTKDLQEAKALIEELSH